MLFIAYWHAKGTLNDCFLRRGVCNGILQFSDSRLQLRRPYISSTFWRVGTASSIKDFMAFALANNSETEFWISGKYFPSINFNAETSSLAARIELIFGCRQSSSSIFTFSSCAFQKISVRWQSLFIVGKEPYLFYFFDTRLRRKYTTIQSKKHLCYFLSMSDCILKYRNTKQVKIDKVILTPFTCVCARAHICVRLWVVCVRVSNVMCKN